MRPHATLSTSEGGSQRFQWSYLYTGLLLSNSLIVFRSLRTLPFSVSSNSFICHSYENTRCVPSFFPFWNSSLDLPSRSSRTATSDNATPLSSPSSSPPRSPYPQILSHH